MEDCIKAFVWYIDEEGYAHCTDLATHKHILFHNNYTPFTLQKGNLLYLQFDDNMDLIYMEVRV